MKTKILKEAEIEWGLRVGPKSNQREQTRVLLSILSKALAQTREETIREVEDVLYEAMDMGYSKRDIIDKLNKLKK